MPKDLAGAKMTIPARDEGFIPAIFDFVEDQADAAIRWYWAAKAWPARLSKGLRLLALLLFGLGALPPFLDAILPRDGVHWTPIGYLALALGGSALAFDHFFGLSSGYTRYVTTAMSLERARNEFRMDWLALMSKYAPITSTTNVEPFVTRASAFLETALDLVDRETRAWVAEFSASLAELEKVGRAPQEPPQPGTLDVTVTGAIQDNEAVDILVDNIVKAHRNGPGTAPVGPLAPGAHVVAAKNVGTGMQGITSAVIHAASSSSLTVAVPPKA